MRIGFDISQTGPDKAGCGYYADSLIRRLAAIDGENQYTLYPLFGDAYCDPTLDAATIHIDHAGWDRGPVQKTTEAAREFWADPPEDFERRLSRPDIVHSNNFYCPLGLKHAKLIYTLHDLAFLEYPELTTEQNRVQVFNGVFNASLAADFIIAISHSTRDHFLSVFPHYSPDRIDVIHPGSRFSADMPAIARPAAFDRLRPGEFWLSVGTLEPRKNHRRLLEAYALLKRRVGHAPPLVLVGAKGWLMEGFDKVAENLGVGHDVIVPGYVDDLALQWLYQNCLGFCYPSLFEGFGLPVLEAMTLGAAVIVSNVSSLPEIVGESGSLVDPHSAQSICQAMADLQENAGRREAMRADARARARQFSWESSARRVLEVYQQVGQMKSELIA